MKVKIGLNILLIFGFIYLSEIVSAQTLIELQPSDVQTLIKSKTKQNAVLVNLWATWCGPCIEEFPDIVYLAEKYKDKLDVIFISGDFPDDTLRVKEYLQNQKVTWPTWIKIGSESEFIDAVHPKWSGALPFTIIFKKGGEEVVYWENKAEMSKFEEYIRIAIQE
jgi:thiol-disulfide isomerase/thioredoxin